MMKGFGAARRQDAEAGIVCDKSVMALITQLSVAVVNVVLTDVSSVRSQSVSA